MSPLVVSLVGSAALAWWPALMLRRRGGAPHARVFVSLMTAVSAWCAISALHAIAPTLEAKLALAKAQYVAICSVAPLWLLLTADYAGVSWFVPRGRRVALWAIPVASMIVAATNASHHALWVSVHLESGRAIYTHG